ncbi:MAG: hypothetical protein MK312_01205, partial [Roseibacillus sp.]|nr:hypothetical protein [Roseibacillus sp.]
MFPRAPVTAPCHEVNVSILRMNQEGLALSRFRGKSHGQDLDAAELRLLQRSSRGDWRLRNSVDGDILAG